MEQTWKKVIEPKNKLLDFKLGELVQYRDLIWMFVKRSFKSQYKQTILGPLWFIINPLITSVLFTVVFGGIAKISTDGVPQFCSIWRVIQHGAILQHVLPILQAHLRQMLLCLVKCIFQEWLCPYLR